MQNYGRQEVSRHGYPSVSVVLWNVTFDGDIETLLPAELVKTLEIIQVSHFSDLSYYLQIRTDVRLVLTCLNPEDLQNLCDIQKLQQDYPDVALMAVMEDCVRVSAFVELLRQYAAHASGGAELRIDGEVTQAEDEIVEEFADQNFELTPRQRDVLGLLMWGKSNKDIARTLNLSEGTVKIHCLAIFRALGVSNRTQAALRAEKLLPQLREHWDEKLRVHH